MSGHAMNRSPHRPIVTINLTARVFVYTMFMTRTPLRHGAIQLSARIINAAGSRRLLFETSPQLSMACASARVKSLLLCTRVHGHTRVRAYDRQHTTNYKRCRHCIVSTPEQLLNSPVSIWWIVPTRITTQPSSTSSSQRAPECSLSLSLSRAGRVLYFVS